MEAWLYKHEWMVPVLIVGGVFLVMLTAGLIFHAGADERDAKFKRECIEQGGKYVVFDDYRPTCVIDGEKFHR